jgi:hypothetical protein
VRVTFLFAVGALFATNMMAFKAEKKLWAAMSVSHPVYVLGQKEPFMLHFAIVNDGTGPVDPEIQSTKLLINGKEWKDWDFNIGQGPRDNRFFFLGARDHLNFGLKFNEQLKEPGIYKLTWKGKDFQAPDVVFRVLPKP